MAMFSTVHTPVLGMIENMSGYVCPHCGTPEAIFGSEGGRREADALGMRLLGSLPLVGDLRASMDRGVPLVVDQPQHPISAAFSDIASQIVTMLEPRTANATH
jgi:ATP-binding protein involved in chromosome partitioning